MTITVYEDADQVPRDIDNDIYSDNDNDNDNDKMTSTVSDDVDQVPQDKLPSIKSQRLVNY